jgi:hypothetical protein
MQAAGVNKVFRSFAATIGLLLVLVATAAGADPLDSDAATAAAGAPLPAGAHATDVDGAVIATFVASQDSAGTRDNSVGQGDDAGVLLGQLITQYFESFN